MNQEQTLLTQKQEENNEKNLDANYFLFTSIILGFKEIPYNTTVLLINNQKNGTLDLVYSLDNKTSNTKTIPLQQMHAVSYKNTVQTSNSSKKVQDNETKSILLSAGVFGGSPLLQLAGNSAFTGLFSSLSSNYEKVEFNVAYEITLEFLEDGVVRKLKFYTEKNPTAFLEGLSSYCSK